MPDQHKIFQWALGIIMVLIVILLLRRVQFFFAYIFRIIAVLSPPLILSGFFYYLIRPILRLLMKTSLPKKIAIVLIFLLFTGLIIITVVYTGSMVSRQAVLIIDDLPNILDQISSKGEELLQKKNFGALVTGKVQRQIAVSLQKVVPVVSKTILAIFSFLSGLPRLFVITPFILFYFLKDDAKFAPNITRMFSGKYHEEIEMTLREVDRVFQTYITGQGALAMVLGILSYFGFLIVNLPYALILAIFLTVTSFIPMFGLLIGVIPAALVGLAENYWMLLKVLGVLVIVNLTRKFIAPHLIGKRLGIHPLTSIIIFVLAASIFGLVGILVAIPAYAVLKEVVRGINKMIKMNNCKEDEPRKRFCFFWRWVRKSKPGVE